MQFTASPPRRRLVNMTSLVDVVFLLLIFFMLTTNFINQRGIGIEVPQLLGKKSSWQGAILIRPNKTQVLINTQKVAVTQVGKTLSPLVTKNSKVIIQPYPNVPLQTVVQVLDQVRNAGVSEISMMQ